MTLSTRGPESPHFALPTEFGLDVITCCVGRLRLAGVPQHPRDPPRELLAAASSAMRSVLVLPEEARRTARLAAPATATAAAAGATRCSALGNLQPDVGHEVPLDSSAAVGEVIWPGLLSATSADLATTLLSRGKGAAKVPIPPGVISDGQQTIRQAVAQELPGVPHQLCKTPLPCVRPPWRPICKRTAVPKKKGQADPGRTADRTAAAEIRTARRVPRPTQFGATAAVRSALTDDRRPPLVASGYAARAAGNHRRQPGPGRGFGEDIARRAERNCSSCCDAAWKKRPCYDPGACSVSAR